MHTNTHTQAHYAGCALEAKGEVEEAEPMYCEGLNMHTHTHTHTYYAGCALEAMGEVEEAEPIYREGLTIGPTDIRLKKALADVMPFVLKERAQRAMGLRNFGEAANIYSGVY